MLVPRYFGPRSSPLENKIVGDFVSSIIWDRPGMVKDYCSMGIFEGEQLVAGTLYYDWDEEAGVIQLSSGSTTKRWLTRRVVNAMFHLPFDVLGCQLVTLRVSERNENMLHIARSFGFAEVYIPRLRGRDEGEFIFTLTDDQWLSSPYRKDDLNG